MHQINGKIRLIMEAGILYVLLLTLSYPCMAEGQPRATITAGAPVYGEKGFVTEVTVIFYDPSLYNEEVKLSYHILTPDGSDVLAFENPRIALSPEDGATARQTVSVDWVTQPLLEGISKAIIRFDLVDEKNTYWFNDNPAIAFESAELEYDTSLLRAGNVETGERSSTKGFGQILPIIFCILGWVAALTMLFSALKAHQLRG